METLFKRPSHLVHHVKVDKGGSWILLKLDRTLKNRLDNLVEKSQCDQLTFDEANELDAIRELEVIFTHLNNQMAHQCRNRLRQS